MSLQISLSNNIMSTAQKENQLKQLQNLEKKLDTLANTKDRFLVDTFYTKLTNYTEDNISVDLEDELNVLLKFYPIYSIQTATTYDSDVLKLFISRLHNNKEFAGHISVKLNGWYVRLIYKYGEFVKAYTKKGRDLTNQIIPFLENNNCLLLEDFEEVELLEIRGELVISKANLEELQDLVNHNISSYIGLTYLCDETHEQYWSLLNFVGFSIITDGVSFSTKSEEYQYLEELGFEVPMYWNVEDLKKETFIDDLHSIVEDCEIEVRATDIQEGYTYITDGLIFTIDDRNYFERVGKSISKYEYGNINLRIGYWQQTMYEGYIQTIFWKQEENQMCPYAVVADNPALIEFDDFGVNPYITSLDSIININKLGVKTEDEIILLVPLYNPNQILRLDAYVDTKLMFIKDKILGVLPCFEDGRVLLDGLLQEILCGTKTFE